MKKGTKIGIIIASAVLAVIVAVIVILSVITTKPLENLADYKTAYLYTSSSDANAYQLSATLPGKEKKNNELKSLLQNCSYSVIQSIFSGRVNVENETYYEDGEVVEFTQTELTGSGTGLYSKYDGTLPKLKLVFNTVKKAKIGSREYEFDTVELLIANTHGEIREITCIAWDSTKFDVQDEETEFIAFPVFKISANTADLYNFIMNANA
jgi:hypothetical protein